MDLQREHRYQATDKMSDLICDNCSLLMVMSRFGISLGFGDQRVEQVCAAQGVDCATFLAVANFISEESCGYHDGDEGVSLPALMAYLKRAHAYFLDFNLPAIRRKLLEAIGGATDDPVAFLILQFFDGYAGEIRRHMEYEDRVVFRYVNDLLAGHLSDRYCIRSFMGRHEEIDAKLKELKRILIKYYPRQVDPNLLNAVLFDLFSCEQDLHSHCLVEDHLFVPAVAELEGGLRHGA